MSSVEIVRGRPLGVIAVTLVVAGSWLSGCGGDHRVNKPGTAGGKAGSAGSAGMGGRAGGAGSAGSAGVGGRAGGAGMSAGGNGATGNAGEGGAGAGGQGEGGADPTTGGTRNTGGSSGTGGAAGAYEGGQGGEGTTFVCENGTFDHDGDPSTTCEVWLVCQPGQYVVEAGTSEADRVCAGCASGTFSMNENVSTCSEWSDCTPGTYVSEDGSADSDRRCEACPSGTESTANNQAMCLPLGACEAGTVEVAPATTVDPAVCEACDVGTFCAGGSAPVVDCASENWDHDANPGTSCAEWTSCVAGTYVDSPGGPTTDRTCARCANGTFSADENAASCTDFTVCAGGFDRVVQDGTSTTDVVCASPFRQFGTSSVEVGRAVAVDASGNVYVAGQTGGSLGGTGAGGDDGFVRKYDSSGTHQWLQQFGTSSNDVAYGVAIDGSGNVYVAGSTSGVLSGTNLGGQDGYLRKYDSSGTHQWTQQFGTASDDVVYGVAGDDGGNVYVSGYTAGSLGGASAGGWDGYLRKYDSGGMHQWTRQFGTSYNDTGRGLAVDVSGSVFVAGIANGSLGGVSAGNEDGYLRKYDSGGTHQWTQQFGTVLNDYAYGVAVDGSGNAYVTGDTNGALGTPTASWDGYLRKHDSSGAHQWTQQLGTLWAESGYGVAVDANGNGYVVGSTTGAFGGTSAGGEDGYVRKHDSSGVHQWTRQLGTSSADVCLAVAVDANANVYATGYTLGSLGGTNAGSYDAFIMQIPD